MKQLNMFGAVPPPKGFDDWWSAYPHKCAKLEAQRAFSQALKAGYKAEDMIAGAVAFAALCRKEGRERGFIPHPATWIRAGRWMDEALANYQPVDPAIAAEAMDKADRYFKRGRYAPTYN